MLLIMLHYASIMLYTFIPYYTKNYAGVINASLTRFIATLFSSNKNSHILLYKAAKISYTSCTQEF